MWYRKIMSCLSVLSCILLLGCSKQQTYTEPVDMTGEWAIEWRVGRDSYSEVIYIRVMQKNNIFYGEALDHNLIPADIEGASGSGLVSFTIAPQHGLGYRASKPAGSHFTGRFVAADSMLGSYKVNGSRGRWNGVKISSEKRNQFPALASKRLILHVSRQEFNILNYISDSKLTTDATMAFTEEHRVGPDLFMHELTIADWREICRYIRCNRYDKEVSVLIDKISELLLNNGYMWDLREIREKGEVLK